MYKNIGEGVNAWEDEVMGSVRHHLGNGNGGENQHALDVSIGRVSVPVGEIVTTKNGFKILSLPYTDFNFIWLGDEDFAKDGRDESICCAQPSSASAQASVLHFFAGHKPLMLSPCCQHVANEAR